MSIMLVIVDIAQARAAYAGGRAHIGAGRESVAELRESVTDNAEELDQLGRDRLCQQLVLNSIRLEDQDIDTELIPILNLF